MYSGILARLKYNVNSVLTDYRNIILKTYFQYIITIVYIYREVFFKLGFTVDWEYDWDIKGMVCKIIFVI